MVKLNELSPAIGSTRQRTRVGRGPGSGKGKTGGRGVKGQKSRSGVAIKGFEGGQMPIYMRLPKRGFTSRKRKDYAWLNLDVLSTALADGKLDAGCELDEDTLVTCGVVRRVRDGVRLLARGEAPKNINITVTGASRSAITAIEQAGGKVTLKQSRKSSSEM